MITKQAQITKQQLGTLNHETFEEFSFLTDFKAEILNSKTIYHKPNQQFVSRITTKGKVKFCNTDFCKASKLDAKTIKNLKASTFTHPTMPKVILNIIKKELTDNKMALGIIKQIDKDGNAFWVNAQFSANKSENLNIACSIKSSPSNKKAIGKIEKIYNSIFLLENHVSYEIAQKYFDGLLEMEYGNYEGFLINAFQ